MVPIFGALQQHREAYAALTLFQRAVEEHNLTNVVIEQARKSVQRSVRRSLAG